MIVIELFCFFFPFRLFFSLLKLAVKISLLGFNRLLKRMEVVTVSNPKLGRRKGAVLGNVSAVEMRTVV